MGSWIQYQHIIYKDSREEISTMHDIENLVENKDFSSVVFASAERYTDYITTEILTTEIVRNVLIALAVVFVTTLFLTGDIFTAFLVLVCVILTIVDLTGFAKFWDLRLDSMLAIFIII